MNTTINHQSKSDPTQIHEKMEILTRESFEQGCQFQLKTSTDKSQLYVSEWITPNSFVLIEYQFASEYGKQPWKNLSQVMFIAPEFFVFNYSLLGSIEVVQRYYADFKVVNYKKHIF